MVLKQFLVEGEILDAVRAGRVQIDPTELRDFAQERGFESVLSFAQARIDERNAFIDSLNGIGVNVKKFTQVTDCDSCGRSVAVNMDAFNDPRCVLVLCDKCSSDAPTVGASGLNDAHHIVGIRL